MARTAFGPTWSCRCPAPRLPEGFDFTDPDVYQPASRSPSSPQMRQTAPVWWIPQPHGIAGFDDEGYWVVTRHADVKYVSTTPGDLLRPHLTPRSSASTSRMQPRPDRRPEADHAEHGPARAHPGPPDRPARLHPARDPRPGGRAARPRPQIVADGAAAATRTSGDFVTDVACELPAPGHRRAHRHPAGRPGQDLRLVQQDGRVRRSRATRSPKRSAPTRPWS